MRILLVEDDALLGDGIRAGLKLADYAVDWVRDGEAARLALLDHSYKACVLDLGLPKRDGLSVLKDLRQSGNQLPVLILTARDAVATALLCYFLVLGQFLFAQTIPTALLACLTVLITTAALLAASDDRPRPRQQLRRAGLMLAQALPFMLLLFLLFPRVQGPLWGIPKDRFSAVSGLSDTMSVKELALSLGRNRFKYVEWKEGTKGTLYSYFARVRVRIANPDCREPEEQTLLVEWPLEEKEPKHYTLLTIPRKTKLKEMVRKTKARWHIEQSYEEMKGELGLDHFEGRSWIGWHHHISITLACYSLVQACKWRAFSPSPGRKTTGGAIATTSSAPRC